MKNIYRLALVFLFVWSAELQAQSYSYKVKYGLVQAGVASLVQNIEDGVLKSVFIIESSPWLSTLWTLSDSVSSEYLIDAQRLVRHTKAIHEGSYHRNYDVTFSDSNMAFVNGKAKEVDLQDMRDIPSLLYDLSYAKFQDGDTLHFHMWDGRGSAELKLLVEKGSKPSLRKPFSEPGWRLTPINSTRKSRANEIQLSMLFSKSFPHTPIWIKIDTKFGDVQMRLEDP